MALRCQILTTIVFLVLLTEITGAQQTTDFQQPNLSSAISEQQIVQLDSSELADLTSQTTPEPTSSKKEDKLESLHDRLSDLEKMLEKEAAAKAKEKADAAKKPTLKINGRIHLDYWNFTDNSPGIGFFENPDAGPDFGNDPEDRIFFRRIRLNFQGDAFETMLYRMQIDFNSPDSGEMKDMYVGFDHLPLLGKVLVGNQKRPLGLDHLNSSRFNVFIERPLVVEAFNEDARRVGIASYKSSDDESLSLHHGVYALENMVLDGEIVGDSMQLSYNARLFGSPWYDESSGGRGYFHWGVSGMFARPDGDALPGETNLNEGRFRTRGELRSDNRWINTGRIAGAEAYEILGLETIFNAGPFQAVGEYQTTWMQRDSVTPGTGPDLHFQGAYFYLAYMLTGEHVPYKRTSGTIDRIKPFENFFLVDRCCNDGAGSGWGAWQVALRYSYLDLTSNDILGGVENNLTLALVWYLNSHASMQFNAVYGDIAEREPVGGFSGGHFTALGTRLRINF